MSETRSSTVLASADFVINFARLSRASLAHILGAHGLYDPTETALTQPDLARRVRDYILETPLPMTRGLTDALCAAAAYPDADMTR